MRRLQHLQHLDAAETLFFSRELEQIASWQADTKYAERKAVKLVPADTSIDPGTESFTWRRFSGYGEAKLIADFSKDFPRVGVAGEEQSTLFKSYGDSFGYSIQELRAAAKAKRSLSTQLAFQAREVLALKLDDVAAVGDSSAGLKGLLNLASTETYTTPDGASTHRGWLKAAKTPLEVYTDLAAMCNQVWINSKEIHRVKRIVMPTAQYAYIHSEPWDSDNSSNITCATMFKLQFPDVELVSWERCAGQGSSSSDRAVGYDPNPLLLSLLLPVSFEQFDPQLEKMEYVIPCHMRTGGVINPFPKSVIYADHIQEIS